MPRARAPRALIDFTTREFGLNPIQGYDTLRQQGPVVWQPTSRAFLLTGYRDSLELLRDPTLVPPNVGRSWPKLQAQLDREYSDVIELFAHFPFVHEGARHAWLRRALAVAVAPYASGHRAIDARIKTGLDRALRAGGFDLVDDFAGYLLFDIVGDLMEIPEDERGALRPVALFSVMLNPILPLRQRDLFAAGLRQALSSLTSYISERADLARDNLLTRLVNALPTEVEDRKRTAAVLAAVMLVMGNDALGACITFAVRRLLGEDRSEDEPAQRDWGEISDDAIRYAAPVDFLTRVATRDGAIAEFPVKMGDWITVSPLCANHDPEEFGPLTAFITKKPGKNIGLAFGAGSHVWVGNRFSWTVVKAAFDGLAGLPELKLKGDVVHGKGAVIRRLDSLPLEFG